MGKGLWLSRQHVRWLIVLLALLPLLPTALLVQVMRQSALGDRDAAVTELSETYQRQLMRLSERYSVARDDASPAGLDSYLRQIFGPDVELVVAGEGVSTEEWSEAAIVHRIGAGSLRGWSIGIQSVPGFPSYLNEQRREAIWNAVLISIGVIGAAALVWFAVHRQLRVDELRGDLLATVSHELKTPIAASRVLIDTLEEGRLEPEEVREYIDMIGRENDRIDELASQFLTFSRLENGQVRLVHRDCVLADLLAEQVELIRPSFEEVGGALEWECDRALVVSADPQGVKVILANLLGNVLKYGGDPPRGRVRAFRQGDGVCIRIRDWGRGVPPDQRRAVFQPYFRGDVELSGKGSGLGLGLAICRRFTRLMRAGLRFVDEGEGGACLELKLPVGGIAAT